MAVPYSAFTQISFEAPDPHAAVPHEFLGGEYYKYPRTGDGSDRDEAVARQSLVDAVYQHVKGERAPFPRDLWFNEFPMALKLSGALNDTHGFPGWNFPDFMWVKFAEPAENHRPVSMDSRNPVSLHADPATTHAVQERVDALAPFVWGFTGNVPTNKLAWARFADLKDALRARYGNRTFIKSPATPGTMGVAALPKPAILHAFRGPYVAAGAQADVLIDFSTLPDFDNIPAPAGWQRRDSIMDALDALLQEILHQA